MALVYCDEAEGLIGLRYSAGNLSAKSSATLARLLLIEAMNGRAVISELIRDKWARRVAGIYPSSLPFSISNNFN